MISVGSPRFPSLRGNTCILIRKFVINCGAFSSAAKPLRMAIIVVVRGVVGVDSPRGCVCFFGLLLKAL